MLLVWSMYAHHANFNNIVIWCHFDHSEAIGCHRWYNWRRALYYRSSAVAVLSFI